MMPTYDPWFGVVVIVYFVWLIGGFVTIVPTARDSWWCGRTGWSTLARWTRTPS